MAGIYKGRGGARSTHSSRARLRGVCAPARVYISLRLYPALEMSTDSEPRVKRKLSKSRFMFMNDSKLNKRIISTEILLKLKIFTRKQSLNEAAKVYRPEKVAVTDKFKADPASRETHGRLHRPALSENHMESSDHSESEKQYPPKTDDTLTGPSIGALRGYHREGGGTSTRVPIEPATSAWAMSEQLRLSMLAHTKNEMGLVRVDSLKGVRAKRNRYCIK
ncbi:hypothetical protein EVAR_5621_1 [Eumeta japonica]|uniref:Uncharacterized protein n=1 Tax=Eumeta variegata TaxID=151549 RepID=A0A4C1T704_EUMVA|nr:hypothetical protein EVAR_5621_1 [Eumeta japonica]